MHALTGARASVLGVVVHSDGTQRSEYLAVRAKVAALDSLGQQRRLAVSAERRR